MGFPGTQTVLFFVFSLLVFFLFLDRVRLKSDIRDLESDLFFYEDETLPFVYDEVTGGTLSCPGYTKNAVLDCYRKNLKRQVDGAVDDFIEVNGLSKDKDWIR